MYERIHRPVEQSISITSSNLVNKSGLQYYLSQKEQEQNQQPVNAPQQKQSDQKEKLELQRKRLSQSGQYSSRCLLSMATTFYAGPPYSQVQPSLNIEPKDIDRNLISTLSSDQELNVEELNSAEKLGEAVNRAAKKLPGALGQQLKEVFSPQALATIVAVLGIYLASHATGAGQVADVAMLLVGGFYLGKQAFDVFKD